MILLARVAAVPLVLLVYLFWELPRSVLVARAARRRLRTAPAYVPLGRQGRPDEG